MSDEAPDPASRPTIVFLHPTRLSGAVWSGQVTALAEEFHCLTPDLRGHGRAAHETFSVAAAAEDVAALIEREAHGGRAIVVGLSLGGYVAMAVAAGWPERVAGLVVSGATAEPLGVRGLPYRGLALLLRVVPDRILAPANRWFFRSRFPPGVAGPIVVDGFWFAGGAVAVRSLVGERFMPRLASYPGPTLLINGEYDLFFRPSARSFAAAAANSRRTVIRRATHLTNLDQPERFTEAVRSFARQIVG